MPAWGYATGAPGGTIAGAVCALIGIAVSVLLKDTLPFILIVGTISSGVTGALGGLLGQAMVSHGSQRPEPPVHRNLRFAR